ncbi:hypothetical protein Tco_0077128 [Tanacetum coccineum]
MLGASGVQIPENNLDNLKLTREGDGDFEIVDPQCLLGSKILEGLDPKILGLLLKYTNFATLVFLRYILIFGLGVVTDFNVVSIIDSTLVEVVYKILLFLVFLEGCDLLALVELFIPIKVNTGLFGSDGTPT